MMERASSMRMMQIVYVYRRAVQRPARGRGRVYICISAYCCAVLDCTVDGGGGNGTVSAVPYRSGG